MSDPTAPTAGYVSYIQIAPDSTGSAGSYATFAHGIKTSWKNKMGTKDVTPQGGSGDQELALTVKSFSISVNGPYDHADTATATLEAAYAGRLQCWAKYFTDGTNYYSGPVKVTELDIDGAGTDINNISVTLMSTGAVTTGP